MYTYIYIHNVCNLAQYQFPSVISIRNDYSALQESISIREVSKLRCSPISELFACNALQYSLLCNISQSIIFVSIHIQQ